MWWTQHEREWIRGFHNLLREKISFQFVLLGCTLISSASFISWPMCLDFLTRILVLMQADMMVFLGLSEVIGLSKKICIKRQAPLIWGCLKKLQEDRKKCYCWDEINMDANHSWNIGRVMMFLCYEDGQCLPQADKYLVGWVFKCGYTPVQNRDSSGELPWSY